MLECHSLKPKRARSPIQSTIRWRVRSACYTPVRPVKVKRTRSRGPRKTSEVLVDGEDDPVVLGPEPLVVDLPRRDGVVVAVAEADHGVLDRDERLRRRRARPGARPTAGSSARKIVGVPERVQADQRRRHGGGVPGEPRLTTGAGQVGDDARRARRLQRLGGEAQVLRGACRKPSSSIEPCRPRSGQRRRSPDGRWGADLSPATARAGWRCAAGGHRRSCRPHEEVPSCRPHVSPQYLTVGRSPTHVGGV